MVELKISSANVKKEDEKNSEHKSVLEKAPQKNGLKENDLQEDILQEDILQVEALLNDDIGDEDFKAKVEKITDKGILIKMVNNVADLHVKHNKDPHVDYKFKILNDHFIKLFGSDEYNKCFEDTVKKTKHHNDLKSTTSNHSFDDNAIDKPKKKNQWWKIWKNKKSKKKNSKNKGSKSTNSNFVSYGGQKKKIDKVKKAQDKGKGNWRLVAKHSMSIGGTALLCGVLSLIVPPIGSLLAAVTAGTAGVLIYRDVKNKSKHRKKISNKVGGVIDKLEDTYSKSNIKRVESELSKLKEEEQQQLESLPDEPVKEEDKISEVINQHDQTKQDQDQTGQEQNQTEQEQTIQQIQKPVAQQNTDKQQLPQTHQQKLQQQNANNGVGMSI